VPAAAGAPIRVAVARPADLAWSAVELTAVLQEVSSLRALAARSIAVPAL
jgi:hypothetical protein